MDEKDFDFEFDGVPESEIPDEFGGPSDFAPDPEDASVGGVVEEPPEQSVLVEPSQRVPTPRPRPRPKSVEAPVTGQEPQETEEPVPRQQVVGGETPVTRRQPQEVASEGGIPDPSKPVPHPVRKAVDYDSAASGGARQATRPVTRQAPQQGQPQKRPQVQRPQAQAQQSSQQPSAQQRPRQQRPIKAASPKGGRPPKGGEGNPPKKKSKLPFIILGVVLLIVVVVVAVKLIAGSKPPAPEPATVNYETSGRKAFDTLQMALNNYSPEAIDAIVGVEQGDSYLAQEWAYVNNVKIRQEFLQTVGAVVRFEYPQVQQMSTTGESMLDDAGNPIMIESYMNNGEDLTITIPDYDKLSKTMDEKADYILRMLSSSKYSENDYSWPDELTNLMLQFVLDDGPIPTKQVTVNVPVSYGLDGTPIITNDAVLDDLLFGSEDFRYMAAKFSQICVGWTGYVEEIYITQESRHNDEYDKWLELFLAYFEADGGIYDPNGDPQFTNVQKAFKRNKSKWEPWYLREPDNPNVIQKYPDGTYIVNYFSVKDENGNDWIQPAVEVLVDVENTRLLDDPWEEETGIWYNWLGMHYLETYTGKGSTVTRVGDGSREHPAGIGTTIITKVLCTDGKYHDIKVALMGYWTGQSAIDYVEKFSNQNRGFTTSSPVQLICFEVYVENLEREPIEFKSSEMTLTDRNGNLSARTGTMFAFTDIVSLEAAGNKYGLHTTILNDWATSTELAQKYVCWGKSFGRQFSLVYFDCLAGTGDIPTYSAYEQFTGKSSIDKDITG